MIKKLAIIILLLGNIGIIQAQLAVPIEGFQKLKKSTVKISIGDQSGSGYFIDKDGTIATCFHILAPTLTYDSLGTPNFPKVFITTYDGKKYEYGISKIQLYSEGVESLIYDFLILKPTSKKKSMLFEYMQLGDLEKLPEGSSLYTCGYPYGITQQVVSSGLLSTKFSDTLSYVEKIDKKTITQIFYRKLAWVDITMNKGNSGGPIVYFDDKGQPTIVGYASFILSAEGEALSNLQNNLNEAQKSGIEISMLGVDFIQSNILIAKVLEFNSVGVSGIISVEHLKSFLTRNAKKL